MASETVRVDPVPRLIDVIGLLKRAARTLGRA
jgi:hypothetical protein